MLPLGYRIRSILPLGVAVEFLEWQLVDGFTIESSEC
jgi:hypothetical protein